MILSASSPRYGIGLGFVCFLMLFQPLLSCCSADDVVVDAASGAAASASGAAAAACAVVFSCVLLQKRVVVVFAQPWLNKMEVQHDDTECPNDTESHGS